MASFWALLQFCLRYVSFVSVLLRGCCCRGEVSFVYLRMGRIIIFAHTFRKSSKAKQDWRNFLQLSLIIVIVASLCCQVFFISLLFLLLFLTIIIALFTSFWFCGYSISVQVTGDYFYLLIHFLKNPILNQIIREHPCILSQLKTSHVDKLFPLSRNI